MREKRIESRSVYKGKILDLKVDTVVLPDGARTEREVVAHPGAVAVVSVTDDNEIVLIRQFRYPVDEVLWEIPAGKLEPEEDPLECAKRELSEETGFGAEEWQNMSVFYTTPGFSDEIMYLYSARGLYKDIREADSDEFIEVHKIPMDDVLEQIKSGVIKDAKTIIGVLLTKNRLY